MAENEEQEQAFTLHPGEDGFLWLHTRIETGEMIALNLGPTEEAFTIMADKMAETDFGA